MSRRDLKNSEISFYTEETWHMATYLNEQPWTVSFSSQQVSISCTAQSCRLCPQLCASSRVSCAPLSFPFITSSKYSKWIILCSQYYWFKWIFGKDSLELRQGTVQVVYVDTKNQTPSQFLTDTINALNLWIHKPWMEINWWDRSESIETLNEFSIRLQSSEKLKPPGPFL